MPWLPSNTPSAENILDAMPAAYLRLDSEFRYTFVNRAAEQLLGKTGAELLGKVLWEVFPSLVGTPFEAHYRRAMAERVAVTFERQDEPAQRWYAVSAAPDSGGGIVVHFADITERMWAEAKLQASASTLAEAQRIAHVGSWEWVVPEYRATWSHELFRIYGRDPAEGVPPIDRFMENIHPDDRAILHEAIRRSFETGEYEAQYRLYRYDDGSLRHIAARGEVEFDSNGKPYRHFGAALDITERKRADEELRESETRFRTVFRNAAVGIAQVAVDGRWLRVNPRLCEITGYTEEELRTLTFQDITHPDDLDEDLEYMSRALAGEIKKFSMDKRYIRKDRSTVWINLTVALSRDAMGAPDYFVSIIDDITERKRAEEEARKSADRLALILEATSGGTWDWNIQSGDAVFSPRYSTMLGYDPGEFARNYKAWKNLVHPDDVERVKQHHADHFAGRTDFSIEFRMREKSGDWHWIHSRGLLIERDAEGKPLRMVGTHSDIQQRKHAEEEKQKLTAQLIQAQKMESVGRLAGGIAHDFNNLLTVINGHSDLMLAKLSTSNPLRVSLEEIHKAGVRAAALTQQLLAFSRKQILQPRVLDLNVVVAGVGPMLARLVSEDVEIRVKLHQNPMTICADPNQLAQMVINLAVNSRDAMPRGGTILIETALAEWDEAEAHSHAGSHAGSYVVLTMSDSGHGMDEETRQHIFEPFFTTKEVGKGTGLGLSMIHGIVAQSGGFIEVVSEPECGATFKIYLPKVDDAPAAVKDPESAPGTRGVETVLVVEDQLEVRELAVAALAEYGYNVLQAADGSEALQLCEGAGIDLVLTDVVMPKMSGTELADRISQRWPKIKLLFMSGYTDARITHHQTLEAGFQFIQKPFSPKQLARKVRETLGVATRRIVVADDEVGVRCFLRTALEPGGYEVFEAADGKEALKLAITNKVDLVITDLVMPEQEGLETIQALRREVPGVGIIAVSGAFDGSFLAAARMLGADAVLGKPMSAEALLAKVVEVLKARS